MFKYLFEKIPSKTLGITEKKLLFKKNQPSNKSSIQRKINQKTLLPEIKKQVPGLLEKKQEVTKETKDKIKKEKQLVETSIKFANRPGKDIDTQNTFTKGSIVSAKQKENLRTKEFKDAGVDVKKGDTLILTGNYRTLVNKKNRRERTYLEAQDKKGNTYYIRGESVKYEGKITSPEEQKQNKFDLSKTQLETAAKPVASSTNPKNPEEPKFERAKEKAQTLKDKYQDKFDQLKYDTKVKYVGRVFESPQLKTENGLKEAFKSESISHAERKTMEDIMNRHSLSFNKLSSLINQDYAYLTLDDLLTATPTKGEEEYKELEKEFYITKEGRELRKRMKEVKSKINKADTEGARKLHQKEFNRLRQELKQKKEAYASNPENYRTHLNYYKKQGNTSLLEGYIQNTQTILDRNTPDAEKEFKIRYNKIKDIYTLASTLQKLDIKNKPTSTNEDKIENVDTQNLVSRTLDHAKNNYKRLNLTKKQLQNLENNLSSGFLNSNSEERNLQLLSTLIYASGKSLTELQREGTLSIRNNKVTIKGESTDSSYLDKLTIALAKSPQFNPDGIFGKDNLTEALVFFQKTPQYQATRQAIYEYDLSQGLDQSKEATIYNHLHRIFDTNYKGKYQTETGFFTGSEVSTTSMEDFTGNTQVSVDTENFLRRYSSDLSLYQDILQEIEVNGYANQDKFISKMNELLTLGQLGLQFDDRLSAKDRKALQEKAKNFKLTKENLNKPLDQDLITMIKYGSVYEQMRNEFLERSPRSPNKKLETTLGIPGSEAQATYAALEQAVNIIQTGSFAAGANTKITNLDNGWELYGGAAAGAYILKNPGIRGGASLTLKRKDIDDKGDVKISLGAGAGLEQNRVLPSISLEVYKTEKPNESISVEYGAGIGLTVAGINIFGKVGGKYTGIEKSHSEEYQKGLENISGSSKLSKESIQFFQSLNPDQPLSAEQIQEAHKYLPFLKDAFQIDPTLKNLPPEQKHTFQDAYIRTMAQQLKNTSIEKADGMNVGLSLTGGMILPAGIPYLVPMLSLEWEGETRIIQTINNSKLEVDQSRLQQELKRLARQGGQSKKITVQSSSGTISQDKEGKQISINRPKEVANIQAINPIGKLNSLRGDTGLTFESVDQQYGLYLRASLDDYIQQREGKNYKKSSSRVSIFVDPSLSENISVNPASKYESGKFLINFANNKLPDNLVILKETITNPTTSGKTTTETRISFTTKENLLTGSEISKLESSKSYISFNANGVGTKNTVDNSLNLESDNISKNVEYEKGYSTTELQKLAEYSKYTLSRRAEQLDIKTHQPTEKLDKLITELGKNPKLLKQLAKVTIHNIENGQRVDQEKANKLILSAIGKNQEFKNLKLETEDYLYIYNNLIPDTFREINSIPANERVERINRIAKQYINYYVTKQCQYITKADGSKFSTQEQKIIIDTFSKHSEVKEKFKQYILTPKVTTENVGGNKNIKDLNGFNLFTTTHRHNLKGLRMTTITPVFETQIIKDSLTKFTSKNIPSQKNRILISEFLQNLSEKNPTKVEQTDWETLKSSPSKQQNVINLLNSSSALLLTDQVPFATTINGKTENISLIAALYGPDAAMVLEYIYKYIDKPENKGKLPAHILSSPTDMAHLNRFLRDIQVISKKHGTIKLTNYKKQPVEINIREEAGVVLVGRCANPTLIYRRKLNTKFSTIDTKPTAAKAHDTSIFSTGKAARRSYNFGVATSLELTKEPTPPTSTPNKPNTPIPETPRTTPRKQNTEMPSQATTTQTNTPPISSNQGRSARANRRRN